MQRRCPGCDQTKLIEEFNAQRKYCLVCHRERGKRWREANREKWLEAQASYRTKRTSPDWKLRVVKAAREWKPRAVGSQYRARAREYLLEVKKRSRCSRCPEADYRCLQFHHIRDKRAAVSEMAAKGWKVETIQAEIEKCIVLCANCHAKEHYSEKQEHGRKAVQRLKPDEARPLAEMVGPQGPP